MFTNRLHFQRQPFCSRPPSNLNLPSVTLTSDTASVQGKHHQILRRWRYNTERSFLSSSLIVTLFLSLHGPPARLHAAQSYGCTICRPPRIWSRPARLSRLAYVSTISLHLVYDKPNMFSLACSARYWSLGFLLSSVSEGGLDIKERHIKVRTKTNCPKDTPPQPSSSQAIVQTQLASQWLLSFSWWSHITVMSLSPQKRGRNSDKWVHLRRRLRAHLHFARHHHQTSRNTNTIIPVFCEFDHIVFHCLYSYAYLFIMIFLFWV